MGKKVKRKGVFKIPCFYCKWDWPNFDLYLEKIGGHNHHHVAEYTAGWGSAAAVFPGYVINIKQRQYCCGLGECVNGVGDNPR